MNLLKEIPADACIVDVRSPEEFESGAYPGAINIPLNLLAVRMGEIPSDRPVITYCFSGGRSTQAVRLLKEAGYNAVNAGGLSDMPSPKS
jgi:phage shock protein E